MTEGMTPADVAAVTNHGYGYGNGCNGWGNNGMFGMEWIFALLILPMLWGGNGAFGRGNFDGNPVTESGLCNAMNANNLENAVGRLSDQVGNAYTGLQNGLCNIGYQELQNTMGLQRDLCQGLTSVVSSINAAAAQQAQCCCDTKQILLENRYLAERSAANTDATVTAQTQKILDALCGNRMADMQNQINQLQLQSALCGVIRYPTTTTYGASNPFFGGYGYGYGRSGCGCNGCNGNI